MARADEPMEVVDDSDDDAIFPIPGQKTGYIDKNDPKYQVPDFGVINEDVKNYARAHRSLLKYLLAHPVVTKKHFYITYIRFYVTQVLNKDQYVVKRIKATEMTLNLFANTLITAMNGVTDKIGLRVTQIDDESNGKELIVLICERFNSLRLSRAADYSSEDVHLLETYIPEMIAGDGRMGYGDALKQATELPSPISLKKSAALLAKLAKENWIQIDKADNVWLAPRAIAELNPLIRGYEPPICKLCHNCIIRKSNAILCEKCQTFCAHSHCMQRMFNANNLDGDNQKCPNEVCTANITKKYIMDTVKRVNELYLDNASRDLATTSTTRINEPHVAIEREPEEETSMEDNDNENTMQFS